MKIHTITFLIICVFLVSCSQAPTAELTPEDQAFLDAVNATDTTFTDSEIKTFKPDGYNYGYTASRTPKDGEVEFTVGSTCGNMFGNKDAAQNAKCLAYFAKTGEINPTLIVK